MSLYELRDNKRRILPLFPSADHHLAMEAVIEGKCEGKIFVDNVRTPETVAVWTAPGDEALLYLAGNSGNTSFNEQLRDYFVETIKPASIKQGLDAFQAYTTHNWVEVLKEVIFADDDIFRDRDSYYILDPAKFRTLQPNWRENIPDGFTLKRVQTEDVFDKAEDVSALDGLTSWKSFEKFMEHGFAYYLVEDTDKIVSGCMTKFVTSSGCELAIGTNEKYRRRGFAALVGCATVSEALQKGLKVIWECYHRNTASVRTNQTLGFDYLCDEYFYFGLLYESVENDLFLGYHHLTELNDPSKAAHWFKKGIALSEKENQPIPSGYNFYAACAFAVTGEHGLAFERLHLAVDGLQDVNRFYDRLQSEKALDGLRSSREFKKILQRLEELIKINWNK